MGAECSKPNFRGAVGEPMEAMTSMGDDTPRKSGAGAGAKGGFVDKELALSGSGRQPAAGAAGVGKGGGRAGGEAAYAQYETLKKLGEGGFGVVHLVRDRETQEEWAAKHLKVTDDPNMDDRMTRADITNECDILGAMHHPSICMLRENFDINAGAEVVMVLELLSGGDLLDAVINNGTYTEADARAIFRQVLDGVGHMHEQGVVHRDLKVENLMMKHPHDLTSVKIIDVGLAVRVPKEGEAGAPCSSPLGNSSPKGVLGNHSHGSSNGSGRGGGLATAASPEKEAAPEMIRGTPEYMAPESFKVGPNARDFPVDVWALGCFLYILLGGYSPYADNDSKNIVKRVCKGEFHPFSTDAVWASVSDEAKDVIQQCFMVKRRERITIDGLRNHRWLKLDAKGADLSETRTKMRENFKGKFKKAAITIRASIRLSQTLGLKKFAAAFGTPASTAGPAPMSFASIAALAAISKETSASSESTIFDSIGDDPATAKATKKTGEGATGSEGDQSELDKEERSNMNSNVCRATSSKKYWLSRSSIDEGSEEGVEEDEEGKRSSRVSRASSSKKFAPSRMSIDGVPLPPPAARSARNSRSSVDDRRPSFDERRPSVDGRPIRKSIEG